MRFIGKELTPRLVLRDEKRAVAGPWGKFPCALKTGRLTYKHTSKNVYSDKNCMMIQE